VRQDSTADKAIINRLSRMGKDAKNWIVVTSDREILVEARSAHSQTLTSADFAAEVKTVNTRNSSDLDKQEAPEVTEGDVDYWLEQFKDNG